MQGSAEDKGKNSKLQATSSPIVTTTSEQPENLNEDGFVVKHKPLRQVKETSGEKNRIERLTRFASSSSDDEPEVVVGKGKRKAVETVKHEKRVEAPSPVKKERAQTSSSSQSRVATHWDDALDTSDEIERIKESAVPKKKQKVTQSSSRETHETVISSGDESSEAAPKVKKSKARIAEVRMKADSKKSEEDGGDTAGIELETENGSARGGSDLSALMSRMVDSAASTSSSRQAAVVEAKDKRIFELEKLLDELRSQTEADAAHIATLESRIVRKEAEKVELKRNAEKRARSAEEEATAALEKVADLEAKLEKSRGEQRTLKEQYKKSLQEHEEATKTAEEVQREWEMQCQAIIDKAKIYKKKAREAMEELGSVKGEGISSRQHDAALDKERRTHERDLARLQKEVEQAEHRHREELAKLEEERNENQKLIDQLVELNATLDSRNADAASAASSGVADKKRLEARCRQLEEEKEAAEDALREALADQESAAASAAKEELKGHKELERALERAVARLKDAEARAREAEERSETLEAAVTGTAIVPTFVESEALGPLENIFNVTKGEKEGQWNILCRDPTEQREIMFSLADLEDSFEYVPMDFKIRGVAANPSDLPDFLARPIYFNKSLLLRFVARMANFLHTPPK